MAKTKVINDFTGGLSQDPREHSTNTFADSQGFDTVSKSNTISPYSDVEAETRTTGDITDNLISDIGRDTNGYIYAVGRTSAGTPTGTTFLLKRSNKHSFYL